MLNKKIIISILLVVFSGLLGYSFTTKKDLKDEPQVKSVKNPILRFALVADSHNDNELLNKALDQAKGEGINFIICLGDYTNTGTLNELLAAKKVFDESRLKYYVTVGDHDLWESRNRSDDPLSNFKQIFGESSHEFDIQQVRFVILDNSDIYKGIDDSQWSIVNSQLSEAARLRFVFAHKTPFHPESKHVMGESNADVADQAEKLMKLMEAKKVDGFFSGDVHFFAQFKSPSDVVKITTIGAAGKQRNFQGPRFAVITVWDDYSWEVEDIEIRP